MEWRTSGKYFWRFVQGVDKIERRCTKMESVVLVRRDHLPEFLVR